MASCGRPARTALLCALLLGIPFAVPAQQPAPVTPDSSIPLFTVMAAVNAAGYDAGLDSPNNSPVRRSVREEIQAANPPGFQALREFYAAHRNPNPARDLSQFISLALLLEGPPDFRFRVKEADLPPEVAALADLRPLLAQFYKEARIGPLWEKYRPAYENELQRYDEGLASVMLEVNGYLRLPSSGFLGRGFWVYVDLLGAPGQVNARSFGPDYYVVASASPHPQLDEVRHGYLHYVLEPMAGKYRSIIRSKDLLHAFADEAHALDPVLRKDFRMLVTESLIRAAEMRMWRAAPAATQQKLRETLLEGHFLAPYFFEALEKFEQQEAGMRIYYPDMIEKIDVGQEQKRLAKVVFRPAQPEGAPAPHVLALSREEAPPAAPTAAKGSPHSPAGGSRSSAAPSEEQRLIAEGEDALARQSMAEARSAFQAAFERQGPMQGHAVYGLALVATLEKQPEVAKNYFRQTLQFSHDPRVLAWANIYLGRIFDMEQNRDLAVKHYQQALAAGDTDAATRQAAERGLQAPFRREPQKEEKP